MSRASQLRIAANIAKGVTEDAARFAEARQHFEAMNSALNGSHVNGEQDTMALFEAFGMMLGQLTGALSENERARFLTYVLARAEAYAPEFRAAGKAAAHLFEG